MSPIIRLALLPLTPPPHRQCPPPSQPLLSITRSPGPSLSSTPPLPSPPARRWRLTRSSLSCAMVKPSTARRPMSTCSVLQSTPGRRTSTVPFTTPPHWYPAFGVQFVKTMVSNFFPSRVPETCFHWINHPPSHRSRQVFNYPRHLSTLWIGRGVIKRPRAGLFDSLRRLSVYIPGVPLFVTTAIPHRVVEQHRQLIALPYLQQRELVPLSST